MKSVCLSSLATIAVVAFSGCSTGPSLFGDEKPCDLISVGALEQMTSDKFKEGVENEVGALGPDSPVCTFERVPSRPPPYASAAEVWAGASAVANDDEAKTKNEDLKFEDTQVSDLRARQVFYSGTGRTCTIDVYLDEPGVDEQTIGVHYIGDKNPCDKVRKIAAQVVDNIEEQRVL